MRLKWLSRNIEDLVLMLLTYGVAFIVGACVLLLFGWLDNGWAGILVGFIVTVGAILTLETLRS